MVLTLTHLITIALAALAAYLGVKWAFRKDTEIENRRREAGRLAAKLREMGFKELPELFIDYSVGDYSGMTYKISQVAKKMMGNDKEILAELSDVFEKLLKIKLAMKEGRMLVRSELEAYERMLEPTLPVVPAVAPIIVSAGAAPAVAAPAVAAPAVAAPAVAAPAVAAPAVAAPAVAAPAVAAPAVAAPAVVVPAPQVIVVPLVQPPTSVEEIE